MMDDIAEQQDVAREISDAISNPVAFGTDVDEDELEKELEELEQESLENDLLKVGPESTTLPDVPRAEPTKAKVPASKPTILEVNILQFNICYLFQKKLKTMTT